MGARLPRPGCFGVRTDVSPAVSAVVAACEMIRRREAEKITLSVPAHDRAATLTFISEMADESGVDAAFDATASGLVLTLTRRPRRGAA